jgi:hypothetical protein
MDMQPFDYYKSDVTYDYILKAIITVEEIPVEVVSLLQTTFDDDFLKMYFEKVALGNVYCKAEIVDNKIEITFGIRIQDSEEAFDEKYLTNCIKEYVARLNKNIATEPELKIEEGDLKVEVIKESKIIIDNIDKKLVSENKLLFTNGTHNQEFKLTDDGIIEHYEESKLKNSFAFSKLGLMRECKNLIQEGYLLEQDMNDNITDNMLANPAQAKRELEQSIKDVEEIQELQNELNDKVDELMTESEQPAKEKFALVLYTKYRNKFRPDVVICHMTTGNYIIADTMEEVAQYDEEDADRYIEIFDRYSKTDRWELHKVPMSELASLNLLKETKFIPAINTFPSTEKTCEALCRDDLCSMNFNNDLNEEQKQWVETNVGSTDELYNSMVELYDEIPDNQCPLISIDEYIQELLNEGGIELCLIQINNI